MQLVSVPRAPCEASTQSTQWDSPDADAADTVRPMADGPLGSRRPGPLVRGCPNEVARRGFHRPGSAGESCSLPHSVKRAPWARGTLTTGMSQMRRCEDDPGPEATGSAPWSDVQPRTAQGRQHLGPSNQMERTIVFPPPSPPPRCESQSRMIGVAQPPNHPAPDRDDPTPGGYPPRAA